MTKTRYTLQQILGFYHGGLITAAELYALLEAQGYRSVRDRLAGFPYVSAARCGS